jgi:hypothetical protein
MSRSIDKPLLIIMYVFGWSHFMAFIPFLLVIGHVKNGLAFGFTINVYSHIIERM